MEPNLHSIEKAIRILEFLCDRQSGATLAEIAQGTGLAKTTAHRVLGILEAQEYVARIQSNDAYRIGSKAVVFGQRSMHLYDDVVNLAIPHLEKLHEAFGFTINMGRLENQVGVYVFKIDPPVGMMKTNVFIGMQFQLHSSALGKCMLSDFAPEQLDAYWSSVAGKLKRFTTNTIADPDRLRSEMAAVRRDGYAMDREENEIGISCVAAPVRDYNNRVAHAVSVSTNTLKLNQAGLDEVVQAVTRQALAISRELGYQVP
jgi:DNA-binding IclR family transcriptional regulator